MRIRFAITLMSLGISLSLVGTGCKKKVAVTPPTPPPEQEVAPPQPPPVPTASLTVEPTTVEAGQTVTLKWSSTDATEAAISDLGSVEVEGKQLVRPATSTTYELVATGRGGTARALATVTVVAPPPPILPPVAVEPQSMSARLAELSDAYFDYDKSAMRDDAGAALTKDAEVLKSILTDFPDAVIVLEGYCDERGSAEYNLGLGERRAESASAYIAALGVPAERLQRISYGKEKPQCTESTEVCWQANRRVHFSAGTPGTR